MRASLLEAEIMEIAERSPVKRLSLVAALHASRTPFVWDFFIGRKVADHSGVALTRKQTPGGGLTVPCQRGLFAPPPPCPAGRGSAPEPLQRGADSCVTDILRGPHRAWDNNGLGRVRRGGSGYRASRHRSAYTSGSLS